jgi:hypothetical protein
MINLLNEDQLLKLIAHKEYTAQVLEEIIFYNAKKNKIIGLISIVECAKNDLTKVARIW